MYQKIALRFDYTAKAEMTYTGLAHQGCDYEVAFRVIPVHVHNTVLYRNNPL